jgi:hypothetical protein
MSPAAGLLLVTEIMPRIQVAVPRSVLTVGAEDHRELVQDTLCSAAQMLDAAERSGKPLYPSSIAYYAIQRTKSGRRSLMAGRTDAMCPGLQLDGEVALGSMDDAVETQEGDELTLHDLLAGSDEDPAQAAARELDWAALLEDCNERDVAILRTTMNGESLSVLARQFGVSGARITQLKREIGRQIQLRWGPTVLEDVARGPAWAGSINASRERQACRHERASEVRSCK